MEHQKLKEKPKEMIERQNQMIEGLLEMKVERSELEMRHQELEITYSELEMGCFFLVPKVLFGNGIIFSVCFFSYERGLDPKGTP